MHFIKHNLMRNVDSLRPVQIISQPSVSFKALTEEHPFRASLHLVQGVRTRCDTAGW
jgi:hypothetical protein